MSTNIRFPNITGKTEAEQLVQVKSYLHQLVEQLNWALSTIESGNTTENKNLFSISVSMLLIYSPVCYIF